MPVKINASGKPTVFVVVSLGPDAEAGGFCTYFMKPARTHAAATHALAEYIRAQAKQDGGPGLEQLDDTAETEALIAKLDADDEYAIQWWYDLHSDESYDISEYRVAV